MIKSGFFLLLLLISALILGGCSFFSKETTPPRKYSQATQRPYTIRGRTYYPIPSANGYRETGVASWYGGKFHGRKTANGETYDMYGATAAHKTLPMHTMLLVRNLDNGRETVVRINDRGPFVRGRVIDLSYGMARDLGVVGKGTARVELIALMEGKQRGKDTKVIAATAKKKVPNFNQGNFFIQIGAFARKKNARLEAIRFSVRGRDVVIQQYATSGRNLYRVLVFGGNTLAKANQYREALDQAGYRDTLVIAR